MKWLIALGVFILVFVLILPLRHLIEFQEESSAWPRFQVTHQVSDQAVNVYVRSSEEKHPLIIRFIEIPAEFHRESGIRFPTGFEEMKLDVNPGENIRALNEEYDLGLDETLVVRLRGSLRINPGNVQEMVFPIDGLRHDIKPAWIKLEVSLLLEKFGYSKTVPFTVELTESEKPSI